MVEKSEGNIVTLPAPSVRGFREPDVYLDQRSCLSQSELFTIPSPSRIWLTSFLSLGPKCGTAPLLLALGYRTILVIFIPYTHICV